MKYQLVRSLEDTPSGIKSVFQLVQSKSFFIPEFLDPEKDPIVGLYRDNETREVYIGSYNFDEERIDDTGLHIVYHEEERLFEVALHESRHTSVEEYEKAVWIEDDLYNQALQELKNHV